MKKLKRDEKTVINLRATAGELADWRKSAATLARKSGVPVTLSAWIRNRLNEAAAKK